MTREPSTFTSEPYPDGETEPVYCRIPDAPLRVLKFGSSVLQTVFDLPRVAGEIYRQRRAGYSMIVAVSALAGETDELFSLARQAGGSTNVDGVADLVSLGEEKTAALLRIACSRLGLDALVIRPEEICIHTSGCQLEATPEFINLPALLRLASRHDLLIVPGFVGIDESGARSLLGRGGSDFTAIFIGGEAEAECVRLYKDVDGVFDHDPASDIDEARKFSEVSWSDCLEVARPLLQPRSMEYAQAKGVRLEVEAIGSATPTFVGAETRPAELVMEERQLRVAVAGFGAVGQAVLARLRGEPRFKTVSVLVRDPDKHRGAATPAMLTGSVRQLMDADADIFVEVTSDSGAAFDLCRLHLSKGRHAVTANKKIATDHLDKLRASARDGARLLYSATVGGGTPVLETVALARKHGEIREIRGVLNGTVNFILERLGAGDPIEVALKAARRAGFAEVDPIEDLSGRDVRSKLRIIAEKSFGVGARLDLEIEPLDVDLVNRITASGDRWVQLATLSQSEGEIRGRVEFVRAFRAPDIPVLRCEQNHIAIRIADGREWISSGRGAGGIPTAEAIVADLYDIARGDITFDGSPFRPTAAGHANQSTDRS